MNKIKIFISYSWDNENHIGWVRKLADTLEEIEEIHVTWDGYDLDSLVDKNLFMESAVHDASLILIVATKNYKKKSDERSGGVGIETFLASAAHWDGMLEKKKSKLVVLKREEESTPRYLSGHFYIDFSDDQQYEKSVEKLIVLIRGTGKVQRPKKQKTLVVREKIYEFTRIEELIGLNHPNRRAIVDSSGGTDFSGSNRIKYELWETKSPSLGYFFALHANANITQTAQHAARKLLASGVKPAEMTVLRPRSARPEQELIATVFSENKLSTQLYEYTYKEYIWDYCIDPSLKKGSSPATVENYTNQSLECSDAESGNSMRVASALDHLTKELQTPSSMAAHLVVAPGGMGKTSLCLSVAKNLHFRNDLRSSVILVQAELIKRYIEENGVIQSSVDSIYDIYELYAKCQGHTNVYERSAFDLAVVCGNLTVIIDGLDELSSLFQDRFDPAAFLRSLKDLHDQLGSSNILLTTRDNVVADVVDLEGLAISKYELLGFDIDSCRHYVTKRFQGYDDARNLVEKVMTQIERIKLNDHDGRIVPFLADIAATVVEDELKEGGGQEFELSEDLTPYASNNQLTDHIIHSILRREETRQALGIPLEEVVEIIGGLASDFGFTWTAAEMRSRLQIIYETRSQDIFSKLSLNPLLVRRADNFELRYSFLTSYFEMLFTLQGILRSSLESEVIRSLSRLSADGQETRELRLYFSRNIDEVKAAISKLIPQLRDRAISSDTNKVSPIERENARGAIETLLLLFFGVRERSIEDATAELLEIYGLSLNGSTSKTLNGLFIKDGFPAIDFSDLVVTNSRFRGYKNLLNCKFARTMFMYSVFENCGGSHVRRVNLEPSMIDSTCDAGDLREVFALSKANKDGEQAMVKAEAKRFLHSFFRGDRFIDNKASHIKFSNKVPGLASDKFDRLVASGWVVLVKEKTIARFYEISSDFKPSVRKYLVDGYPDARMKQFFSSLR
ncbi:TIR domain-containing protein [Cupriavidus sp. TMH.W2]|uniref:TIR domain-containing protein n=1 Tax=Cupriavidus sp. TMH.W2 TaxID=3434465 RepID=UPI003D7887CF